MARSLKKGPYVDPNLKEKLEDADPDGEPIKTWARDSVVTPEMIGYTFSVHNGKEHIPVKVNEEMVGHKLGEFARTKKFNKHGGQLQKREEREEEEIE